MCARSVVKSGQGMSGYDKEESNCGEAKSVNDDEADNQSAGAEDESARAEVESDEVENRRTTAVASAKRFRYRISLTGRHRISSTSRDDLVRILFGTLPFMTYGGPQ